VNAKLWSARWWVTLLVVGTGCALLLQCIEVPSWFALLVGVVVRDYFGRGDRGGTP
jgi:hypothetical protein